MKDFLIVLAVIFAFVGGLFATIVFGQYKVEQFQCQTIHEVTGAPTLTTLSAGCLVKIDGRWMAGDAALTNHRDIEIK